MRAHQDRLPALGQTGSQEVLHQNGGGRELGINRNTEKSGARTPLTMTPRKGGQSNLRIKTGVTGCPGGDGHLDSSSIWS